MLCRVEPADDPDFELSTEGGAVDEGQEEDVPISDADTAPQVRLSQAALLLLVTCWATLELCFGTQSTT